jgi:uncharacterized membrane protein
MAQDLKTGQATGPADRLKSEARDLVAALGDRAVSSVRGKVDNAAGRLTDYLEGGAGPGLIAAVTGAKGMAEGKGPIRSMLGAGLKGTTEKVRNLFGGGGGKGGGKGKKLKVTNIVESIDVGVPIDLAYNQWTQFTDFPSFTKKVENVEQEDDPKVKWRAQIFWSHREWESTILEQIPDDRIVWRSTGQKGHVDGAVTFHKLAPNLTRILLVLEYHPQGMFEHTGNLWRAQGRRARLEFKQFRRHMMSEAILHPEEIEGWRGVIRDSKVVMDHEEALEQERSRAAEGREEDEELAARPGDEEEPAAEARGADEDLADEDEEYADEEYPDEEYADEEYADARDEGEYVGDEYEEEGEEEPSPNGRGADERPARTTRSTRVPAGGHRSAGGQPRSGRSGRPEERPQAAVRRRTAPRRGNSQ